MILYHGSYIAIPLPSLEFARNTTDFGKGFYTTSIQLQADKWAERHRRRKGSGIVSIFEINIDELKKNASTLEFDSYSMKWLDYILNCRQGLSTDTYDLVTGGIANDDVFNTLTLFFRGFIDKAEAIKRLRHEKPNIQYCFKTQNIIDKYLIYKGNKTI